jgi:Glycosyltransferase family 87
MSLLPATQHLRTININAGATARRLAVVLCLGLLAGFVLSYAALVRSGDAGPKQTDFVPYYATGQLIKTGMGAQIYDRSVLGKVERELVRPLKVRGGAMPYLYPAYFATALAPLTLLPYDWAFILWFAINCVLLLVSLIGLQRYSRCRAPTSFLFWTAALSFLPVLLTLAQGQTSALLLAAFTGVLLCVQRGRYAIAGVLLALAMIKAPYVAPVLGVLLLRRHWSTLAGFGLALAALLVAPVPFVTWSSIGSFVRTLADAPGWTNQVGGFSPQWNQGFAGLTGLIFPPALALASTIVLCTAAILFLGLFTVRSSGDEAPVALAILIGLLVSPHVLLHDLSLLLIPAAFLIRYRPSRQALALKLSAVYVAIVAGLVLVTVLPIQAAPIAMCGLGAYFIRLRSQQPVPSRPELC